MINMNNVINDYKAKVISLDAANEVLKDCGIQLNEKGKVAYEDISKINGIALLDSGSGFPDPTQIKNGKLVDGMASMYVNVIIGNLVFEIKDVDQKLVYYMEKK